jgi:hypothetical protein
VSEPSEKLSLKPAWTALRSGHLFTGFVYLVLAGISPLARRTEDRTLSSDLYVMF